MKITPKQYAQSLFESVKDKNNQEAKKTISELVHILVKNNQKSQLPKIISYFNLLWNREKNIVEAEIISAEQLDKKTLQTLEKFIKEKVKPGVEIDLKQKIDENIKGGFIVRLGDRILDASLSGRIREFKKTLN